MTGLKSGSGDDLWGDSDESDDGETIERETTADGDQSTANDETEQTESTDQTPATETSEADSDSSSSTASNESTSHQQPYIVRRAVQDKSVQFERDERLTFFVHDDVVEGERDLITEFESSLGRNIPKFDIREAVYRAALRNREDILEELLKMGYAIDEG